MLFIEILLSIHCLLLMGSWFIGGRWLANKPSYKLKLVRLLLVSCVISPLIVHCVNPSQKPDRHNYLSFDAVQDYVNQPILKPDLSGFTQESIPALTINHLSYCQLFYLMFCLFILFRGYRLLQSLVKLKTVLDEAIPYRASGRLIIKVTHHCHIPFSIFLFNKAYIILPVSLLSSSKNVKIAIAHEGQHHRNRDCLWAYFIESIRIVFFGNPAIAKWHRVLCELQEFSCDEVLVGQPKISAHDYGHCLFKVVQTVSQCSLSSNREFACTVGMALNKEKEDSTFIIRRISMLSTYPRNASKPLLFGIAFAGFSILAPICMAYSAVGSLTSHKTKEIDMSHLNPKLQQIAAKEIAFAVNHYHAKSGVIVMADPNTGNIIAFAEAGKSREESWRSRVFSPGSTIKPFIAAAAIDAGISSESKNYDCHSPYSIEGKTFTNYNSQVSSISLTEAISKSVNTCLIKVAQDTGAPRIRKKLTEFGFDMNSWWQTNQSENLQLAKASLGENIPVTVETLAKSYAILANKGHMYGTPGDAAVSETTANSVTRMLEKAVQEGTGIQAAIPGVSVAGKTGTVAEDIQLNKAKHLALFGGYVPAGTPRYVTIVVIEDGYLSKNDALLTTGGELAAPVFRKVALNSLDIPNR